MALTTMQAAVYRGNGAVHVEDVPLPVVGPGEVLVRVSGCGVCPTDLKKIAGDLLPPPRIFGHETVGAISQVGGGVSGWAVGDRVAVMHHWPCATADCAWCERGDSTHCPVYARVGAAAAFEPAGGGFSEYVRVLPWCVPGLVAVPEQVADEAAVMIEPLATCLRGMRRLELQSGDTVLVYGLGAIGQLFVSLALRQGAIVHGIDTNAARRAAASSLGASVFAPGEEHSSVAGLPRTGADAAIVAAASDDAVSGAIGAVCRGGTVLVFGHTVRRGTLPVSGADVCVDEKTLMGSYGSAPEDVHEAADLIFAGAVDAGRLVTHRLGLARIAEALAIASNPRDGAIKVMVTPRAGMEPVPPRVE